MSISVNVEKQNPLFQTPSKQSAALFSPIPHTSTTVHPLTNRSHDSSPKSFSEASSTSPTASPQPSPRITQTSARAIPVSARRPSLTTITTHPSPLAPSLPDKPKPRSVSDATNRDVELGYVHSSQMQIAARPPKPQPRDNSMSDTEKKSDAENITTTTTTTAAVSASVTHPAVSTAAPTSITATQLLIPGKVTHIAANASGAIACNGMMVDIIMWMY